MPDKLTRFRVFISSPSNLDEERAVISKNLEQLSSELSEDRLIEFKVFDWKNDVVPGIASEPQAVVSSQLDYDIYVGILGVVFGTPTASAGSGTEEEFTQAYNRFKELPSSVRVLFYFKQSSDRVFDISLEQLSKVLAFRNSLGKKGVLWQDFKDLDSLQKLVRAHFRSLIRNQWNGDCWIDLESPYPVSERVALVPVAPNLSIESISKESEDDERQGLLEAVIDGKGASARLMEHLDVVTKASTEFASALERRTSAIAEINAAADPESAKQLLDAAAGDLRALQTVLREELPRYKSTSENMLTSLRVIVVLFFEEKTGSSTELSSLTGSLEQMVVSMRFARTGLQTFKQIIESIPSFTMELRSAKKHLALIIDDYISSYTVFIGSSEELVTEVRNKLPNETNPSLGALGE